MVQITLNMNKIKLVLMAIIASIFVIGCNPNIPPIQTIEPSQTAFLIPLEGQTSNQTSFNSEKFLEAAKVATKRVEIPQRWRSTGSMWFSGEWIPTVRLIVVERHPVSKHWDGKGAVTAESLESIGFSTGMAITAQIDESDAARFLYRYNNKPLDDVVNDEVLNRVRTLFVENCNQYTMADLLKNKGKIMNIIRADVEPYFKERGINITSLGLVGEFTYVEERIQNAINKNFEAQQSLIAQKALNETTVSKAKADALAAQILNNPQALLLKRLELQAKFLDKWNGTAPNAIGQGSLFSLGFNKE